MVLGPRGLFETLEDGTIIYYGKMGWNAPGYIVDEATMKAVQRLRAASMGMTLLTIPALIRAGFLWLSLALGIILTIAVHVQHKKLVKDLPVSSCHFSPGFGKRQVLLSQDAPYWMLIPGLFIVFPFAAVVFWSGLDDPGKEPVFTWTLIGAIAVCELTFAVLFLIKLKISLGHVMARLKGRRK